MIPEHEIAIGAELMLLRERARYLEWLKKLIKKLENSLQVDLSGLLKPQVNVPEGPFPPPGSGRYAPIILPMYESHLISSGDGDGAPAKALVLIKKEFLDFHQQEIKRLQNEISRFEK